ncbi:GNAT family N-acetyltransferase [Catenulispora yoronensis]|uniref:GNAT family N-acetyltransferase n=1 Tax=Catenulispora yoronensis TaxID=450799 RepID=A0ABN2U5C4_9ACTN
MLREPVATARLLLTPLSAADAEEMVPVLAAPELYAFIGGEPPTPDALRARYARQAAGGPADGSQEWHNWIVRRAEDGVAVGTVQATVVDAGRAADVAWVVGAEFQGRGYAAEAAGGMVAWLREHGVAEVRAHIHPDHAASARVAGRVGLAATGVLDDDGEQLWRDGPAGKAAPTEKTERMETNR